MVAFHLGLWKRVASLGSCCQESSQNLAVVPECISQRLCAWMKTLCFLAAFQINDLGLVMLMWMSSSRGLPGAYLACQIWAHGECRLETHFHQILGPMVLLLWKGSLRPSPPANFGRQTSVHLMSAHFLLSPEEPHKKFLWRLRILLRTHLGAANMENKTKAWLGEWIW